MHPARPRARVTRASAATMGSCNQTTCSTTVPPHLSSHATQGRRSPPRSTSPPNSPVLVVPAAGAEPKLKALVPVAGAAVAPNSDGVAVVVAPKPWVGAVPNRDGVAAGAPKVDVVAPKTGAAAVAPAAGAVVAAPNEKAPPVAGLGAATAPKAVVPKAGVAVGAAAAAVPKLNPPAGVELTANTRLPVS